MDQTPPRNPIVGTTTPNHHGVKISFHMGHPKEDRNAESKNKLERLVLMRITFKTRLTPHHPHPDAPASLERTSVDEKTKTPKTKIVILKMPLKSFKIKVKKPKELLRQEMLRKNDSESARKARKIVARKQERATLAQQEAEKHEEMRGVMQICEQFEARILDTDRKDNHAVTENTGVVSCMRQRLTYLLDYSEWAQKEPPAALDPVLAVMTKSLAGRVKEFVKEAVLRQIPNIDIDTDELLGNGSDEGLMGLYHRSVR